MSSYVKYPWVVLVAVFVLRLAVGFHFFREGWTKVEDGFASAGFFGAAVGPLAPLFHGMAPDYDGRERLAFARTEAGEATYDLGPTKKTWLEFRDRAVASYGIGDAKWEAAETENRKAIEARLKAAREAQDGALESDVRHEYDQAGDAIRRLKGQRAALDRIHKRYEEQLELLFAASHDEILQYFRDLDRVEGYRDDPSWTGVDSLRGQVDKVEKDARKARGAWLASVDAMWDGYEAEVNALATPSQIERAGGELTLRRPWLARPNTTWVDSIIPWFDVAIGALLILGLFSRFAGFFAAGFLSMVVLSQWPWAYGAAPVYYQFVEFAAALCLMAFPSGQFLGLDGCLRSLYLRLTSRGRETPAPATA